MKVIWRGEPMKLWAKLSKRVPIHQVGPALVVALALAGILGHGAPVFRGILELLGNYWG
jgi:hypothetical protein